MNIQSCAETIGLTPSTLRYYERNGLLPAIARDKNGYRIYSEADIDWLKFVTRMRDTGMPLKQIREFKELHFGDGDLLARLEILEQHSANMKRQRAELDAAIDFIDKKIGRFQTVISEREKTDAKT